MAKVDREISRLTEAVATGTGAVPAIVERLQDATARRLALVADLEHSQSRQALPPWPTIERQIRQLFPTWHERFISTDVQVQRDLLRRILKTPIQFKPTVHDDGHVDLHYSGQLGLSTVFEGVVANGQTLTALAHAFRGWQPRSSSAASFLL